MKSLFVISILLLGAPAMADSYADDLARWKAKRVESIAGPEGWATLVARAWIEVGDNTIGSDPHAALKLPADRAPARVGVLTRTGEHVHAKFLDGVNVTADGALFREGDLVDDRDGKETVLQLGSLSMRVIKRGDKIGLRVKDREHPARKTFPGLTYYDVVPTLRVQAHLVPFAAPKTIPIVNILGQTEQMDSPGTLHFAIAGKPYTLDAVREKGEDSLFVIFRDATAGHGTYPAGRFVYTKLPDAAGNVDLDFNRAFNPPCAFTNFATCPLPPTQNKLPIAIEAGEKYAGHHE